MIQLPVSQYVPRSALYIDLVASLAEQTNTQKIAELYENNLNLMQEDIIKFGNVLAEVLKAGEFREADADITYGGTSVTFSLRSIYGHWIVICFNMDGKHEFYLGFNANSIELYNLNVDTLIVALKSYNKIQVVTAVGEQLANSYVRPTPQDRENE